MAARKTYHHGDLKRALVEVSIDLIEAEGPGALSVAEAGRRLGVSSAAPYRHFKDRKALLRAIAAEGNRRLSDAILKEVGTEKDPQVAFALSGVGYVVWAATHPELYRVTFDPDHIEFANASPEGDIRPPEGLEQMATFWPSLSALVCAHKPLSPSHPLIVELSGRALAHGLASMFVTGVFSSLKVDAAEARRIARATMGLKAEKARPQVRKGKSKREKTPRGKPKSATPQRERRFSRNKVTAS